ncbi:MAG: succinylglutamate desuccinylase/aspartoacylase family protein [Bacilli bacterium]
MEELWTFGNLQAAKGERTKGHLQLEGVEEMLPAFLVYGSEPGPTVLVMAGIHGCEYTSIDAALRVAKELPVESVRGRVIVLPIANPAAFYARSIYVHPGDGKNLNRVFPGKREGSESERLAFALFGTVFRECDAIIDLHGGDMIEALVPFTIYHVTHQPALDAKARKLAGLFGVDYAVASAGQVPGSTYGSAAQEGKLAVIAEAGQLGVLDPASSQRLVEGAYNALRYLGVLDGEVVEPPCRVLENFDWYRADSGGLWYPAVRIGDRVLEGQLLGRVTDEFGDAIHGYRATRGGVVLFLVMSLAMNAGDPLLAIGG